MRIAVIGARGFVGAALCDAIASSPSAGQVVPVTRDSYERARADGPYDVVVNAAMPSKRFWAHCSPALDFTETVEKTFALLNDWQWTRFVQISSISARSQPDTVYGRHKAAAESLCGFGRNLTVRLGPLYGEHLTKGPLVDLALDRTVHAAGESRYCYAPVDWVARTVVAGLDAEGLVELGANDSITLAEVAERIGSASEFKGAPDHQETGRASPDAPAAAAVVDYVRSLRRRLRDHDDARATDDSDTEA